MEPFFAVTSKGLAPQLAAYVATHSVPQSAHFDEQRKCYAYRTEGGVLIHCGGLVNALQQHFFPHIDMEAERAKKRRWRSVKVSGSNSATGKRIDAQLLHYTQHGKLPKRAHKWSKALAKHFASIGHTMQSAQLPLIVQQWNRMTQADLITMDSKGRLWLWEIKSGMPLSFWRKNGTLQAPYESVPYTVYNQWQLQLHYTRLACEAAGLEIYASRIIQIYSEKGGAESIIKVIEPEKWIAPKAGKSAPKIPPPPLGGAGKRAREEAPDKSPQQTTLTWKKTRTENEETCH